MSKKISDILKLFYISMGMLLVIIFLRYEENMSPVKIDSLFSKNGILNLQDWNQEQFSAVTLNGEWELYWEKFLLRDDLINEISPDVLINVPSVWNDVKINNNNLPGIGYATYRLHIDNAKIGQTLAMRISPMSTSYKLYIDNEMKASNGTIGTSKDTTSPEYEMEIFEFTPQSNSFDIILQVSNFTYARGGAWYSMQLGTVDAITQIHQTTLYRDIFLIGCFFIMLIHSITIYALRRNMKSFLYFALMCISSIARIVIYSSYIIASIPIISNLNVIVRIDYITTCWIALSFMMLSKNQFTNLISPKIYNMFYFCICIFSVFVLIVPIYVFTHFTYVMQAVCIACYFYTLVQIIKKYLLGYKNAGLLVSTSMLFFACGIHDVLLQNNTISGGAIEYFSVGFLLFMLCEDFVLARDYANTMEENEKALKEIEVIGNKERIMELKFLKAQINPHFIHNALNAIIAISRKNPERSRNLLVEFSQYLRSCFDFNTLEDLVPIEKEINFIHSYIEIEKARFGESLQVEYEIDDLNIYVPPLVLQPLVENAVLHGIRKNVEGGKVTIYIKKMENQVCIGVKDDGAGIDSDRIEALLNGTSNNQGVGLYNINQRLNKIYHTSLIIDNNTPVGTNIYMYLPLENGGITN